MSTSEAFAVASLFLLTYSGYIKNWPLLRDVKVDVTILSAALTAVVVVVLAVARRGLPNLRPIIGVWICFIPGVVIATVLGLPSGKSVTLFTITLLCAIAAPTILSSQASVQVWSFLHLVVAVAGVYMLLQDPMAESEGGRLSIDGSTTILSSRLIFGGCVVLTALGVGSRVLHFRVLALVGAVSLAVPGIWIGSRGPFLAAVLAIAALVMLRRGGFAGKGSMALLSFAGLFYVLVRVMMRTSNAGVERISALFQEGGMLSSDRNPLYVAAAEGFLDNLAGWGWGGYERYNSYGGSTLPHAYPHNLVLEIGFEGGLVGVLALVIFAGWSIQRLRAQATVSPVWGSVLYALSVYWVLNSMVSSDINGNRATWVALACAAACVSWRRHADVGRVPGRKKAVAMREWPTRIGG